MISNVVGAPLPYGRGAEEMTIASHQEGPNLIRVFLRGDAVVFQVVMDDAEGEIGLAIMDVLDAIQTYGRKHES